MNLFLNSQLAKETELFDDLSIDVIAYDNPNNISLDKFVKEEIGYTDKHIEGGDKIDLIKPSKIMDIDAIEVITSGWRGKSLRVYLVNLNTQKLFELRVFSAGQNKKKF